MRQKKHEQALIWGLVLLVGLVLVLLSVNRVMKNDNRSTTTRYNTSTTTRGDDCGDIEVAMHFGSAIFVKKIPGASIIKIEQDKTPIPEYQRKKMYWFKVHYTHLDKMKVGHMAVNKARCITVVSPN